MLESFNLRQQLDATRKELAHALYQHDAACRVIARLMRERDEAQQMLRDFQLTGNVAVKNVGSINTSTGVAAAASETAMEVEQTNVEKGIGPNVIAELNAVCKSLSSTRKGRKPSDQLQSKEDMMLLEEVESHSFIKGDSKVGVTCLALKSNYANGGSDAVLLGSTDKSIVLGDISSGKVHCKMTGHKGKITAVAFSNNENKLLFSASEDKTVRVILIVMTIYH